jgi:hypothetical protein
VGNKLSLVISQWGRATFTITPAPVPESKGRKVLTFQSQPTTELLSNLDESQVREAAGTVWASVGVTGREGEGEGEGGSRGRQPYPLPPIHLCPAVFCVLCAMCCCVLCPVCYVLLCSMSCVLCAACALRLRAQVVLTTLLTSRHHHPYAQELVQWNRWLSVVRDVLGSFVTHGTTQLCSPLTLCLHFHPQF